MTRNGEATKIAILESAKKEFLKNGFSGAHLRVIAKNAGVTTGALYRHYKDKDAIFEALIATIRNKVFLKFENQTEEYINLLNTKGMAPMWNREGWGSEDLVNLIYDHWDEFKLLVCVAEQTESEGFLHQLIDLEVQTSILYLTEAKKHGMAVNIPEEEELHIIAQIQFASFFELLYHDIPKEKGIKFAETMNRFFIAGWKEVVLG